MHIECEHDLHACATREMCTSNDEKHAIRAFLW